MTEPLMDADARAAETGASGRDSAGRFTPQTTVGSETRFRLENGNALKTGEHSQLVRSGIATGQVGTVAAARLELREELGEVGIVKGSLADAFVELGAVRDYHGGRLASEGPLTTKGRQRALLTAYLAVVDRQTRLAQVLGVERRVRDVTFDAAIAREPEAR